MLVNIVMSNSSESEVRLLVDSGVPFLYRRWIDLRFDSYLYPTLVHKVAPNLVGLNETFIMFIEF
jgi:hypothetical protein